MSTSSAGVSIGELRELAKRDLEASNELQARIDQLYEDVNEGKSRSADPTLMSNEHKLIGRDLVLRIEQIEAQKNLTAVDREMLQALTTRLSIHDLQSARLAQYRDLQLGSHSGKSRIWLEAETSSSEAQPESVRQPTSTQPRLHSWMGPSEHFSREADFSRSGSGERSEQHCWHRRNRRSHTNEMADIDKSTWPLLYRIVDIDPKTPDYLFQAHLDSRYRVLAMKHHPERFPNDPSAPECWELCIKAYEVLKDPERKKFYDLHMETPRSLAGLDVSKLNLDDDTWVAVDIAK